MYNKKDLVQLTVNTSTLHWAQSKRITLDLCFGDKAQEVRNQAWPQEEIDVELDVAEQVASEVPIEHPN